MFDEQMSDSERDERGQEELRDRLKLLIAGLETRADERVKRRQIIENRWLEDLRQFHGVYSPDEARKIEGSEIFENQTRNKTNAMAARLGDLLFPTDDKNWGIEPTPVPELAEGAEELLRIADRAAETNEDAQSRLGEAVEMEADEEEIDQLSQEAADADDARTEAERAADELEEIIKEARDRSKLMSEEIDDQLIASRYGAHCRDAIMDACKIGTGILKGPIIGEKQRRRWTETEDGFALTSRIDTMPAVQRADPWHTFLDPDCKDPNDGEGVFERKFLNKRQMRKLADDPDMDKDAIREIILAGEGQDSTPHFAPALHDITGEGKSKLKGHFLVWEYSGPIDYEDMETYLAASGQDGIDAEADPLFEANARIWFCQGRLLKFAIYPLDSGESLYSAFNLEEDEVGPYGYGIPYVTRHNQAMLNGAARMLMDNAGFSAGPQILVDKEAVEPENGEYKMEPRKVWLFNSRGIAPNSSPFQTFDVPTHQVELQAIMELALRFMDDDAQMPKIAQGDQGAHITKTAQGMSILMNAANVVFKRVVKDWDDRITIPMITRFYDFNMQFSPKSEIKGDYDVKARGSSVLLVREMLSQNLIMIAQIFGDHPRYAEKIDHDGLLSEIFRAHQIPAGTVIKTARQIEKDRKDAERNPSPELKMQMQALEEQKRANDLKDQELELKAQLANLDAETRRYVAQINKEVALLTLETKGNIEADKINATLNDKADAAAIKAAADDRASEAADRRMAVEVAMKEETGVSSGGAI